VTVAANAIVSGTGTVRGATMINGTISPGDSGGASMGRLNFNAGLTAGTTPTGFASMSISNNHAGDSINITRALTLNGNSNFTVSFAPGYPLLDGESWDLMDWSGGALTLGGFSTGTNLRTGANGNEGNLDLPDLTLLPGYNGELWQIS